MRPPLAGKRDAARKLVEDARRLVAPVERRVADRLGRARPSAGATADTEQRPPPAEDDDALARLDQARSRLRATIPPPDGDDAAGG